MRSIMSDTSRRGWLGLIPAAAAVPLYGQTPPPGSGYRTHNILDYGAKGDGQTLDTAAVQAAIDACHGDRGGVVLIPAGDFLVGTLQLKSYVTLHLSPSGRLLGSGKSADYSAGKGVPPGNGNVVLLYAVGAENVTIEGGGTIDGQGQLFYTGKGDNTGPGGNAAEGYRERPHLGIFYRCRNVLVRDVFLTRSAYHCVRLLECSYVRLDGVRIHNRVNLNNDGFHINSSQYVNIVNCNVMCQDDACALFGSNKFVTVTNCTFSTRWSIFRFGNGECENVTVSNCVIYDTYGCAIKMRFSAGARIENVAFSNLVMRNVTGPISIGLDSNYRRQANAQAPPRPKGVVRNLTFQGIRATVVSEGGQFADMPFRNNFRPGETRSCITLNGVGDEYLEGITMNDIHVTYGGGGTAEEAARREIPKMAGEYFELGTLPAYGLYARNVRGLTLSDIRFEVSAPDLRPAMVFDHVEDATVNGFTAQGNAHAELLRFTDSRDVLVSAARVLTPAAAFLQLEGEGNGGITVDGGDLSKAGEAVVLRAGAEKDAVRVRG
jgi:Glycosyl hydrolases family 28